MVRLQKLLFAHFPFPLSLSLKVLGMEGNLKIIFKKGNIQIYIILCVF